MNIDHDSWPAGGRLGICNAGEYRGCYILITAESGGYWLGYVSDPPEVARDSARHDDFIVGPNLNVVLEELAVEWVPLKDEERREAEVFGLRAHWRAEGRL